MQLLRSESSTFNMGAIRINKGRIPIFGSEKKQIYMNCIIANPTVSL